MMNVWEKIEWVREQPEHIRMRYVFGCLIVSMAFVIGIWLLSLKESFGNISRDVSNTAESGQEQLPDVKMPALDSLLEQSAPLGTGANQGDGKTGEQYFEEQFRSQSSEQTSEPTYDQGAGQMSEPIPSQNPLQIPNTNSDTIEQATP